MAAKEAILLRRMPNGFGVETLKMDGPVLILVYNYGDIKMAQNVASIKRTKHIDFPVPLYQGSYCERKHRAAILMC
jgi:hypothetical protein